MLIHGKLRGTSRDIVPMYVHTTILIIATPSISYEHVERTCSEFGFTLDMPVFTVIGSGYHSDGS